MGVPRCVPAALLAGHEPHRAGLLQGQGAPAAGRVAHPRGADRRDGPGAGRRVRRRRTRVLRALRLPLGGPTAMTNALGAPRPDWRELDDEVLRRAKVYV